MPLKELFHGLHLHGLKPKKELSKVYIFISLRYLAFSMIHIFIPLYLYNKLGYTLNQTLFFYIVYAFCFAILTLPAAKLVSKIGTKYTILSSFPFYLLFFLLLYSLERFPVPFYAVAVCFSLAQSLYWIGFHTKFTQCTDHDHRGTTVGRYLSLAYAGLLLGPLAGGFLIDNYGFPLLFVIVAVLFSLAGIFLLTTEDRRELAKIKFRDIFSRENLKNSLTFICYGSQAMAEGVLWPLFVFIIIKTYTNLGLLGSAISAVVVLVSYMVGRMSDKFERRNILSTGGIIYSLTWLVRHLFSSIGYVFGVSMFAGFSFMFIEVPMEALTYDKAEKNIVEMLVFREMALNIGRIAVLLIVILTGSFLAGFMFSALAGIGYLFF